MHCPAYYFVITIHIWDETARGQAKRLFCQRPCQRPLPPLRQRGLVRYNLGHDLPRRKPEQSSTKLPGTAELQVLQDELGRKREPHALALFLLIYRLGFKVVELDAPAADGLAEEWRPHGRPFTTMGDGYASFQQQFFDIPIAEREPVVQPYGVADHGERKTVAGEFLPAQHRVTLP